MKHANASLILENFNYSVLMQKPLLAVVILNWNGKKFLEQFLPFLKASVYENMDIVVADNASTDDSVQYLQHFHPDIRVIRNETNEGFAKGYNTALKQVSADYYVLLNSDVEVTPGWIDPVIALMEADRGIAACQPKVLSWHQKQRFEYAGAAGGWIDDLGYLFCRGRVFDICEEDTGQYDDARPVFWASGCALFVRASVFHAMHGFDEFFFAHQEEVDLCWRMQLAGYKIYVCPASAVYHVGGGALPYGSPQKVYFNFRNSLIMLFKNYGTGEKWRKIPLRMVLDGVSAVQQLLKGNFRYFFTVIKAHFGFYGWLFSGKDERWRPPHRGGRVEGVYRGSIVWQYFVRKRTLFSQIVDNKNG